MGIPGSTSLFFAGDGLEDTGYNIKRSTRFNSADSAYLNRTPASFGNQRTWTWSGWAKRSTTSATGANNIFAAGIDSNSNPANILIRFDEDTFEIQQYTHPNTDLRYVTNALYRDVSAWYHIVVAMDTTNSTAGERLRLYINGSEVHDFSTETHPSQNATTYVNSTDPHLIGSHAQAGVSQYFDGYLAEVNFLDGIAVSDATSFGETDATTGQWIPKEYTGSYGTNGFYLAMDPTESDPFGHDSSGNGNDWTANNIWSGAPGNVDASGFVVTSGPASGPNDANLVFDGDTSTVTYSHGFGTHYVHIDTSSDPIACSSTDTLTIYWSTSHTNPRDAELVLEFSGGGTTTYSAFTRTSGVQNNTITIGTTGSITDIRFDETSASNPGELHLRAIKLNGTFLAITQETDLLADVPGAPYDNGLNGGGNYATLNSLNTGANLALSNGNLRAAQGAGNYGSSMSTIGVSSGKWYCEMTLINDRFGFGVGTGDTNMSSWLGQSSTDWVWRKDGGGNNGRHNGSNVTYTHLTSTGDVIGLMLDLSGSGSQGILKYSVNGVDKGAMVSNIPIGPDYFITCGDDTSTGAADFHLNFGQRAFDNLPTGYKALNTYNLPEPTIVDPSDHFNVVLYDGDGSSDHDVDAGLPLDMLWIKNRGHTTDHYVMDTVRGNYYVYPNGTWVEGSGRFGGFNGNTFNLSDNDDAVNELGDSYVAWAWDGGSSTVSNTDGSITSSVRANPTAGFSCITYTGAGSNATIGHGLGKAPEFIVAKNRTNAAGPWYVYHQSLGYTDYLKLNDISAASTYAIWPAAPTSTVFTGGSDSVMMASDYVAYAWSDVAGYSAFGSYEGGSAPFVFTGFLPRWVMIKNADMSGEEWTIFDAARDPYNAAGSALYANNNSQEFDGSSGTNARNIDFLSNGFKINTGNPINQSGTHVYAAFAESPFRYSNAR